MVLHVSHCGTQSTPRQFFIRNQILGRLLFGSRRATAAASREGLPSLWKRIERGEKGRGAVGDGGSVCVYERESKRRVCKSYTTCAREV